MVKALLRFSFSLLFFRQLGFVSVVGLLVLILAPGGHVISFAAEPIVMAARVGGDQERTRFVADLSGAVKFETESSPDGRRFFLRLSAAKFNLPTGAGQKVRGLISRFSYGIPSSRKPEIVIDTAVSAEIAQAFLLPAKGKNPARLVLDLVRRPESKAVQDIAAAHEPSANTSLVSSQDAKPAGLKTIMIDPGHGGIDPGAVSPRKVKEKDVVLEFGFALRSALQKSNKFNVLMTRDDDTFVSLKKRVAMARDQGADLLIALHADTIRGPTARGLTVYTVSDKASDAEAEALAQAENKSDLIAGIDLEHENAAVADILIELAQRETKNLSQVFAKTAVEKLRPVAGMTGKPLRSAGFVVLKAPDVPSVLVELGYLSSREDEKLMLTREWREKVAAAMAQAIDDYFSRKNTVVPAAASP